MNFNIYANYRENNDEPVLFQWIEKIREFIQTLNSNKEFKEVFVETQILKQNVNSNSPEIEHGSVIQDRKSIFQGHVANVYSKADVE